MDPTSFNCLYKVAIEIRCGRYLCFCKIRLEIVSAKARVTFRFFSIIGKERDALSTCTGLFLVDQLAKPNWPHGHSRRLLQLRRNMPTSSLSGNVRVQVKQSKYR